MSLKESESIYHKIQMRPLEVSERMLAQTFEQARFDPRLMEVATEFIRDFWWNINPKILNKFLKINKSPLAIKPALYALIKYCTFPSNEVRLEFTKWHGQVASGLKNPNSQLFYIGIYKLGSKSIEREVSECLDCFKSFNLYSKDLPFNKGLPGVIKTKKNLLNKRFDHLTSAKIKQAMIIKNMKQKLNLTNAEMIEKLKINRLFLSKILNNNLDGITLDYLIKKNKLALEIFGNDFSSKSYLDSIP